MTQLRYFTTATVERLRETIVDRLDWYYAPTDTLPEFPMGGVREATLPAPRLATRLKGASKNSVLRMCGDKPVRVYKTDFRRDIA